ncbi:MAG TPA: cytochrome c oxidase subunit 3 [Pyrinomonadaceae bacterium]|nr:cytochrome c oxidase subunit 3 [Pyrinomonadaceae bacterium]
MVALVQDNQIAQDPRYGRYRLGMFVGLASVVMLFTGLSSAYIVRAASAPDWLALPLPRMLWVGTGVLLISSATLEAARRSLKRELDQNYRRWLGVTSLLGAAFLCSQLFVWRQLVRHGVYIATHPHSSFFYLLTATHGLHLAGGLLALLYLLVRHRSSPPDRPAKAKRLATTEAITIYWHFMDALWIYLFLLLFLWR